MSRDYIPAALRKSIADRGRHRCAYCLSAEAVVGTPMEIDHIVPESLGGETQEDNLCLACALCNSHKGDRITARDPVTGNVVRLFDPLRQVWLEHFAWSEDGTRVVGLTSIGRATVVVLNLNRAPLVKARTRWVEVGWHPPRD